MKYLIAIGIIGITFLATFALMLVIGAIANLFIPNNSMFKADGLVELVMNGGMLILVGILLFILLVVIHLIANII